VERDFKYDLPHKPESTKLQATRRHFHTSQRTPLGPLNKGWKTPVMANSFLPLFCSPNPPPVTIQMYHINFHVPISCVKMTRRAARDGWTQRGAEGDVEGRELRLRLSRTINAKKNDGIAPLGAI